MSKAAYNVYAAGGAATTYIEDVFSTYLYTGTGSAVNINTGLALGTGFASTTNLPSLGRFSFKDFAKSGSNIVALGTDAGDGTIRYYYSVNSGASFSLATIDGSGSVMTGCAIYGGKMFLASNGGVFSSDLGTNSFSQISGSSAVGLIKVVNGLLFVAFSNGSNPALRYSSNGTTFTTSKGYDAVIQIKDITYGDGYYFLYATNVDTGTTSYIYRSTDLTTWTQVYSISMGYEPRIAYGYGKLVMGGAGASYNGKILYSTNYGSSFTTVTISNIGSINTEDVDFDGTNFFLRKGGYAYSADAISWTPTDVYANYVDYSDGNYFIAPGENYPAGFVAQLSADKTITNGKGGLVWLKGRSAATGHKLIDTVRGANKTLKSNTTAAETNESTGLTAFLPNGFRIGTDGASGEAEYNDSAATYASWTFRKQPKFFDVVTYTGNGVGSRAISHNLGSVPGCIIIKRRSSSGANWPVYHRSLSTPNDNAVLLNLTNAALGAGFWSNTPPTSTTFTVSTDADVNVNGDTFVAYLFAHNAGGFGLTGNDNVITCGSYTGTGAAGNAITLGYEPQWLMIKRTDAANVWHMQDIMRGSPVSGGSAQVYANQTNAEFSSGANPEAFPTSTGFTLQQNSASVNASGGTYIYIAIRRGPMKVPTTGTSVFYPATYTGNSAQSQNVGFNGDLFFIKQRQSAGDRSVFVDRLRGPRILDGANQSGELTPTDFGLAASQFPSFANSTSVSNFAYIPIGDAGWNGSTNTYFDYVFRRAPGFFDVVCYTGSGSTSAVTHNLGVQPELIFYKSRTNSGNWIAHTPSLISQSKFLRLNSGDAAALNSTQGYTNSGTPTTTTITPGSYQLNTASWDYVAYLFATCPGVSKVGSYTGNGSSQTIDCGFAAGARFILIKRTDSSGYWNLFDTARGIVTGNDPFSYVNLAATEVTGYDLIDPANSGFIVNDDATYAMNATGGTYIFLAIA